MFSVWRSVALSMARPWKVWRVWARVFYSGGPERDDGVPNLSSPDAGDATAGGEGTVLTAIAGEAREEIGTN